MPGDLRRIGRRWLLGPAAMLAAFTTFAGCTDATSPRNVAGTYVLHSVQGMDVSTSAPVDASKLGMSGSVTLHASGRIEMTVRFDGETLRNASGTYRVRGSSVELRLQESGRGEFFWAPQATLAGGVLSVRHPSPVDGPDIVERYARQ